MGEVEAAGVVYIVVGMLAQEGGFLYLPEAEVVPAYFVVGLVGLAQEGIWGASVVREAVVAFSLWHLQAGELLEG